MTGKISPAAWVRLRDNPAYKPERLLKELKVRVKVSTDSELARIMDLHTSMVSRVRSKQSPITMGFIVAALDSVPSMSIAELRDLCGLRRDEEWWLP